MSRESLVLLLGIVVLFAPVIGTPDRWKNYGLITVGILLVIIGYSLRRSSYYRRIDRGNGESGTDSFTESQPSLLDAEVENKETV